jgi:hypothetical protein
MSFVATLIEFQTGGAQYAVRGMTAARTKNGLAECCDVGRVPLLARLDLYRNKPSIIQCRGN